MKIHHYIKRKDKMPFISKNKYKIFSFGRTYYIKDKCVEKVKKLEEFREFIWSVRPWIWLPLMIVSIIISAVISFVFLKNFEYIKLITIYIMILLYVIVSIIYYIKIRKAISCEK